MTLTENLIEEFGNAGLKLYIENRNEIYLNTERVILRDVCHYISKLPEKKLISLFASDEREINGSFFIYHIFADRQEAKMIILRTPVSDEETYPSITDIIYTASFYEREIYDLFGLYATGHPQLKRLIVLKGINEGIYPMRKVKVHEAEAADYNTKEPAINISVNSADNSGYIFDKVEGEGVFEIPVGPVHAGIIEPGHFRFSVAGEPVINLEAQLYYVHRGIEKLAEGMSIKKCLYLAERISGDETVSNSLAYCQAIEKLAEVEVPAKALYTRVVFAELERLTSHLGDLAGICLDVAYGFAAYQFRILRGWTYLLADELCKMRFLRSVIVPGGVRRDFLKTKEHIIKDSLLKIRNELLDTIKIIKKNSLFIDRVENTGVLKNKTAVDLNVTGPAGRASGVSYDMRCTFPYAAYGKLDFKVVCHNNGDVNCRMNVKLEECLESIRLILDASSAYLALDKDLPSEIVKSEIGTIKPFRSSVGYTESPRGENIHYIMIGENNTIYRYKIRTPSFCNWQGLCHAVNGNVVPDFPLINKSFNLSYAGNDL